LLGHSNVLLRLNSLLQGGPLFRGQTSATFRLGVHVLGSVTLAAGAVEYVRFRARRSWLVDAQSRLYNVLAVDHRELTNMAQYSDGGDRRNIGIGFREFGVCDPDDFEFRLEIMDRRDMQVV
ncbi:hypothetical protein, partial [Burkholderia multivorans]|uniref:hypothetical protein n=1 Tax=Burkholderia multivorans TaxID=87883 RepID=UPI001C6153AB